MSRGYKITDFVKISNHRIFHQREKIFAASTSLELTNFLKEAYTFMAMSYPKFHKMDSLCKLGILGSEVLFQGRNVDVDTALVLSNSAASLETDKIHQAAMEGVVSPAVFVYTLPNIVSGEISIKYKLQSENAFFILEKFDAALLTSYAEIMLDLRKAKELVCGWIELKDGKYDVFLCLISKEGKISLSEENLEELYLIENE